MKSLDEARAMVAASVARRGRARVALGEALGRVLWGAVAADREYPDADRSMMDGYGCGGEGAGDYRIVAEVPAGGAGGLKVGPGEAVRIFTGAVVPEGVRRVVPQEEAEREGMVVRVGAAGEKRWIRPRGSEAKAGERVLKAGQRLGAAEMAILAQVGEVEPEVVRGISVRHVVSGDELVGAEREPGPGQIRDSNSVLLRAMAAGPGVASWRTIRCGDDFEALKRASEGGEDLLLWSGGASVGDYDYGARVLRELGYEVSFERVNLKPGKPLTFATRGEQAAFLVPGNPVSHWVCFHAVVRLAFERMAGLEPRWDWLPARVWNPELLRGDARETLWPGRCEVRDGVAGVRALAWSSSGNALALAGADALIRLRPGAEIGGSMPVLRLGGMGELWNE